MHTSAELSGGGVHLALRGDLMYMPGGPSGGIRIFDVSNPQAPIMVGSIVGGTETYDVAVSGDIAFLATSGISVVDISNPATPRKRVSRLSGGARLRVAAIDNLAYLSQYGAIDIFEVDANWSLQEIGSITLPGPVTDVMFAGDYGYVLGGTGLHILDVRDPRHPVLLGHVDADGGRGLAVIGDRAFVAAGIEGVHIIDIANPLVPALLGSFDTAGDARGVSAINNLLYVADTSALLVVDVSNPATPQTLASYNNHVMDVVAVGTTAFTARNGLQSIDISQARAIEGVRVAAPRSTRPMVTSGNLGYLPGGTSGLHILDLSDPLQPTTVTTIDTPGEAFDVAIDGNIAFVADGPAGVTVIDLSAPASSSVLYSRQYAGGPGLSVAINDEFLLLGGDYHHSDGLLVLARTNLTDLQYVALLEYGTVVDIDIQDNWARTLARGAVVTLDLSQPFTGPLNYVSYLSLQEGAQAMSVEGNFIYTVSPNTLSIINSSDPTKPSVVSEVAIPRSFDVTVTNGVAYVTDGNSGLLMFDVSDPTSPQRIGDARINYTRTSVGHVVTLDNHVYVKNSLSFDIFPMQCMARTPVLLKSWNIQAEGREVLIEGRLSECDGEVRVQAVAAGTTRLVDAVNQDGCGFSANDRLVEPNRTDLTYELLHQPAGGAWAVLARETIQIAAAPAVSRLRAQPNPFNPNTEISFGLPRPQRVSLSVFNIAGRRVATLLDAVLPAGAHRVTWDGRDAADQPVASSVYLLRLETSGRVQTYKVVLTK